MRRKSFQYARYSFAFLNRIVVLPMSAMVLILADLRMFEDTVNGYLAEAGDTQKLISRGLIYIDGEILRVAFGPGFFRVGIEGEVAGFVESNIGF